MAGSVFSPGTNHLVVLCLEPAEVLPSDVPVASVGPDPIGCFIDPQRLTNMYARKAYVLAEGGFEFSPQVAAQAWGFGFVTVMFFALVAHVIGETLRLVKRG